MNENNDQNREEKTPPPEETPPENPSDRVFCPECGATNYPDSEKCWQCEALMREEPVPDIPPPAPREPAPETPPDVPRQDTDSYILWGFILAVLGLICCCCPWIFSIAAIILGAIAYSRGDQRGLWVIIAGVIALLAGSIIQITSVPFQRRWVPYFPDNLPGPLRRI